MRREKKSPSTKMSRRTLVVSVTAASATYAAGGSAADIPKPKPASTNPLAARIDLYTVVTPDLARSTDFYCRIYGAYEVAAKGRLKEPPSRIPGIGPAGRQYVLLRGIDSPKGIRLLEAPPNAAPNRPHPGSNPWDPGFCIIEGGTRDYEASYTRIAKAGIKTISPPMYYFFRDIKPLNGADRGLPNIDVRSYAGFGPAGEEFYVTCNVAQTPPKWTARGLHTPFGNTVIAMLDRKPVWDFYQKVLGLLPTSDIECAQESTNVLIGAPRDLYFRWGGLGERVSIEWDEYRRPSSSTYPTSLDRTGHAAFTVTVDDLDKVRTMIAAAGIPILADRTFPR